LRERINEILKIIESNYGSSKGKNKWYLQGYRIAD
jgi:hypothetical protein